LGWFDGNCVFEDLEWIMNKEEQKKLLEELEARKKAILEESLQSNNKYVKNINLGAILGINDAITMIKKDSN
jgi:hypothetical protein